GVLKIKIMSLREFFPLIDQPRKKYQNKLHLCIKSCKSFKRMENNRLAGQRQKLLCNLRVHTGAGTARHNDYCSFRHLDNEHCIAISQKAVFFLNGLFISFYNVIVTAKCRNLHKQSTFGHVKV